MRGGGGEGGVSDDPEGGGKEEGASGELGLRANPWPGSVSVPAEGRDEEARERERQEERERREGRQAREERRPRYLRVPGPGGGAVVGAAADVGATVGGAGRLESRRARAHNVACQQPGAGSRLSPRPPFWA